MGRSVVVVFKRKPANPARRDRAITGERLLSTFTSIHLLGNKGIMGINQTGVVPGQRSYTSRWRFALAFCFLKWGILLSRRAMACDMEQVSKENWMIWSTSEQLATKFIHAILKGNYVLIQNTGNTNTQYRLISSPDDRYKCF
jgi:hypothetical protein